MPPNQSMKPTAGRFHAGLGRLVRYHPDRSQRHVGPLLQLLPERHPRRRPQYSANSGRVQRHGFVAGHGRCIHGGSRRDGRRARRPEGQRTFLLRSQRPRAVNHCASCRQTRRHVLRAHQPLGSPSHLRRPGRDTGGEPTGGVEGAAGSRLLGAACRPRESRRAGGGPAVLFNYVGPSTVDSDYLTKIMSSLATREPPPQLSAVKLDKRGFLSFVFDGRYKFARYYAPTAFKTPQTLDEIFKNNDVQLFDLQSDADEMHNLALAPEKNKELILRMNGLLNDLIAKEVGVNDGRFLAPLLAPK